MHSAQYLVTRDETSLPIVRLHERENYADAALRFGLDHRGATLVSIISSLGNYQNRPERSRAPARIISIYSRETWRADRDGDATKPKPDIPAQEMHRERCIYFVSILGIARGRAGR